MKKSNYFVPAILIAGGLILGMIGLAIFDGEPGETWFHVIGWPAAAFGFYLLISGQPKKKTP